MSEGWPAIRISLMSQASEEGRAGRMSRDERDVERAWQSWQRPRSIRDHRGSCEGVQDSYAGRLVVGHVAGHHREAVDQCRRRDLFVQRILRMRNP